MLTRLVLAVLFLGVAQAQIFKSVARMYGMEAHNVRGTVSFEITTPGQTIVTMNISGLPLGVHSMYIKTLGDIDASVDLSPHYNPAGKPHGCCIDNQCAPTMDRHVGDLGNFTITMATGFQFVQFTNNNPDLVMSGEHSIVGRQVVIYDSPDDCSGEHQGIAVSRGVIGIANVEGNAANNPNNGNTEVSASGLVAVIKPTKGNLQMSGFVLFRVEPGPNPGGLVEVYAVVQGLLRNEVHAIRVRTFGDLSDWDGFDEDDGKLSGSDYDPWTMNHHATPDETNSRHAGDLGNMVTSDEHGNTIFITDHDLLNITGAASIAGRAVVIYSGADQGQSHQPDGAPGEVWGIGIIGLTNRTFPTPAPTPRPTPRPIEPTPWYKKPGYEILLAALVLLVGVGLVAYYQRVRRAETARRAEAGTSLNQGLGDSSSLLSIQKNDSNSYSQIDDNTSGGRQRQLSL